jgi:hypothetical protein
MHNCIYIYIYNYAVMSQPLLKNQLVQSAAVMIQPVMAQLAEYVCSNRINRYKCAAVMTQLVMAQMARVCLQ